MTGRCLTFYVFIVSTILFAIKAGTNQGIQPIPDWMSFANLILLAIVPTVISNITLVLAVRGIGGAAAAVLGGARCIGGRGTYPRRMCWGIGFQRTFHP